MLLGTFLTSLVSTWSMKFRPYVVNGKKIAFCGRVSLHYKATDSEVKYEVLKPS